MAPRVAKRPFTFTGCVELRQTLDVHALDERELGHRLQEVPAESIFFHTFGYFLPPRPSRPPTATTSRAGSPSSSAIAR